MFLSLQCFSPVSLTLILLSSRESPVTRENTGVLGFLPTHHYCKWGLIGSVPPHHVLHLPAVIVIRLGHRDHVSKGLRRWNPGDLQGRGFGRPTRDASETKVIYTSLHLFPPVARVRPCCSISSLVSVLSLKVYFRVRKTEIVAPTPRTLLPRHSVDDGSPPRTRKADPHPRLVFPPAPTATVGAIRSNIIKSQVVSADETHRLYR